MNRIYYTIDGKPKPQKRHSPQKPPQKVWHLIAQAKALGVKLVSVMNRDPSAQDKREFNLQSRRYAPKEPIVGPVLLYLVFYMPVPKGAGKGLSLNVAVYDEIQIRQGDRRDLFNPTPLNVADSFSGEMRFGPPAKTKAPLHTKRPDVDNLLKLVKDSLTVTFAK